MNMMSQVVADATNLPLNRKAIGGNEAFASNVVPLHTSNMEKSLRGRMKMKNDQIGRLRKKVVALEARVSQLEMENAALRAEISELKKDNEYLKLELKRQGAIIDMLLEDRQQARKPGLLTRLWRFFV